jgi:hypothetical protein
VLTLSECFGDQGEGEEAEEEQIQLFEAGEDAPEAFQPAEEALDLVAFPVHRLVVLPWFEAVALGRNDRDEGVNPTLTLVANSRGTELEGREVGAARLGKRRSVCPGEQSVSRPYYRLRRETLDAFRVLAA